MFDENYGEMLKPIEKDGIDYSSMSKEEILIETIKASVYDWIEKYHPRYGDSNLQVKNPENKDELIKWKEGVIGRISHQFLSSGIGGITNKQLSLIIAIALHEYFYEDPWYFQYLLDILPSCNENNI